MRIHRGIAEAIGWGAAIWVSYHILKDPSVEEQCWEMARATRMSGDIDADPDERNLRLHKIERNANLENAPDNVVRGCIYDACYFTRPKWDRDTITRLVTYVPRDRKCEAAGREERM